jgi:hypothetical protein
MERIRDREYTPQKKKKNSIEELVGNDKNGYPVPNPNKAMINVTKKPSDAHKKNSQREKLGRNL